MASLTPSRKHRREATKWKHRFGRTSRYKGYCEALEPRCLMSITTTTVSSTELGTIGSYLDSGTTGIAGITPPSGWQDAGAATSLIHLPNFDTSGGKVLLQADLSFHADAVSQFVDNNATFNFQPDWTINNVSSQTGSLQALDPNNFPNLDPQGAILRATSSLSLSTALTTSVGTANSGTSLVTISPNPLAIPPGPTVLSQNDLLIGTAQTATIANASDLNTISTSGLDFQLSGSSPSSFNLNVPGFTNNGGAVGGRRGTVTANYTYVTPVAISGEKFLDVNGNGVQDAGDNGLQGWEIDLTGTTAPIVDENNVVLLASQTVTISVFTDANGNFSFDPSQTLTLSNGASIPITGLLPGTYTVSENNAFNLANHPGITGSYTQTLPGGSGNYNITIGANGTATSGNLTGNNFGNHPNPVSGGGASATMGFWHNKNGMAVILSATGNSLSNWLASNYPNLYGNLMNHGSLAVYSLFVSATNSYFGSSGPKTNAQVLTTALACYFDSINNTGTAQKFGFGGDLLDTVVPINGNAAAFPSASGGFITVGDMLKDANNAANPATHKIYGGSGAKWIMVNDQFDFVNQKFDIP